MTVTPADRRAALRLLRFVGLQKLAARLWGQLSQGERQRVRIRRRERHPQLELPVREHGASFTS